MQSRSRRIVPLRAPAADAPPAQDCAYAASATRARLQETFADFYNALFDAACVANDDQRHEHTIRLLRAVKAQESAIIAGICADVARSAAPGEAPEARWLARALAQHCAALPLQPGELALLERALAEQTLAPQMRAPAAHASPAPPHDRDSAARLAARLRAVGMELQPASAADGADSGPPAPAAATPPPRPGGARRAVALTLLALAVVTLSALLLEPVRTAIRAPAPSAARTVPPQVPELTPAAADLARQEAAPERGAIGTALASVDAAPVTEPAPPPAAGQPADAVPAPEAPAAAAETVTAPTQDAPPAAARLATQVDYLLRRGDAALAALRLAEPFADSAAANYAAVLAIDAHNAAAQQGLERVVESYAALARGALSRGDVAYAQQLLARARTVLPEAPALAQLEQAITNATEAGR
jgi:hypothetical protein